MTKKLANVLHLVALAFALAAGPAMGQVSTNSAVTNVVPVLTATNRAFTVFGLDKVPWLEHHVGGVPLWQYLVMIIYIVLAFLVAKLIDYVIGVRLKKWAEKTETKWDDILVTVLHGPTKVVCFVILLHVGFNVFPWPGWLANYLSKALLIVVACSLTYVALKLVDAILGYWKQRAAARGGDGALDEQLFPLLRTSMQVFVVIVGVLLTTQNLGVNITAASVTGGFAFTFPLPGTPTYALAPGAIAVYGIELPAQTTPGHYAGTATFDTDIADGAGFKTFTYALSADVVAHAGDVNGDGQVSLLDYNIIKAHFGNAYADGNHWNDGDVNSDLQVGLLDFNIVKAHFGHTTGDGAAVTAVPEPATISLLALAGLAALRRKQ